MVLTRRATPPTPVAVNGRATTSQLLLRFTTSFSIQATVNPPSCDGATLGEAQTLVPVLMMNSLPAATPLADLYKLTPLKDKTFDSQEQLDKWIAEAGLSPEVAKAVTSATISRGDPGLASEFIYNTKIEIRDFSDGPYVAQLLDGSGQPAGPDQQFQVAGDVRTFLITWTK